MASLSPTKERPELTDLPPLRIPFNQQTENYTYAGGTPQGIVFNLPARNKPAHAVKLRNEFQAAQQQADQLRQTSRQATPELVQWQAEGVVLTFFGDPNSGLNLESLERLGTGIVLLSLKVENTVQVAKVFVPEGRLSEYLKLVNAYANSVRLTFEAEESAEQQLTGLADPDNGIRVFGEIRKADGRSEEHTSE